jgi:hypothetical protein
VDPTGFNELAAFDYSYSYDPDVNLTPDGRSLKRLTGEFAASRDRVLAEYSKLGSMYDADEAAIMEQYDRVNSAYNQYLVNELGALWFQNKLLASGGNSGDLVLSAWHRQTKLDDLSLEGDPALLADIRKRALLGSELGARAAEQGRATEAKLLTAQKWTDRAALAAGAAGICKYALQTAVKEGFKAGMRELAKAGAVAGVGMCVGAGLNAAGEAVGLSEGTRDTLSRAAALYGFVRALRAQQAALAANAAQNAPVANGPQLSTANPRTLLSRQGSNEMTPSRVQDMAEDMMVGQFPWGRTGPIDVAEGPNGVRIIMDGHHRAAAARQAGIESVPIRIHQVSEKQWNQYLLDVYEAAGVR